MIIEFRFGRLYSGRLYSLVILLASISLFAGLAQAGTLDDVKARDMLHCGVSQGLPGFSNPDDRGNWTGLDVDVCRAIAAAVLEDPDKVKFIPLSAKDRFTSLQSGDIDVLSRNTTWTLLRDTKLRLDFTAITFYDGQGFMVRRASGVKSLMDLDGATLCANTGTTTERNAADFFDSNNMEYELITFEKSDETVAAYDAGRCDSYTTDSSGLAAQRLKLAAPEEHMVLPEVISKEPLGPVVRQNDSVWGDIVRWSVFAMLEAEELDVSSSNVRLRLLSRDPKIRSLLGRTSALGESLGLDDDWAYRIIRDVGNYGEVFERNVGKASPLELERGQNALWKDGGLHYAPPVR